TPTCVWPPRARFASSWRRTPASSIRASTSPRLSPPCATSASPVTKPSAPPAMPARSSRSPWKACSSATPAASWIRRSTDSSINEKARSMRAFSFWRSASQQLLDLAVQRIQRERLGQYWHRTHDRAAGFVDLDGVTADEDHLQVRSQLERRLGDHHPRHVARQAEVGNQQVELRLGGENLECLGRAFRSQHPVAFVGEEVG